MEMSLDQIVDSGICEQFTGCDNAGAFRDFAHEKGYQYVEVLDWTSSAGDWQFIVSRDGKVWFVMSQENNWPRSGFSRFIDETAMFHGTSEEVLNEIAALYY